MLTAFETYSYNTYRIDAIVYWYRLWVKLEKDVRDLVDEQQSVADSAIYVAFALTVGAAVVTAYAVGGWLIPWVPVKPFSLKYLPSPSWTTVIAAAMFALARLIYLLSLNAQRTFGDLFKSLFDQFRDRLDFVGDITKIVTSLGGGQPEAVEDRFHVAARLMRWHEIRPAKENRNYTPEEWAKKSSGDVPNTIV